MIFQAIFVVLAGIFMGMSLSAGIGGGTIINSLLIVGLHLTVKESIVITYVFLLGGALGSTIFSFRRKNSEGKRLIDYELIMMTLPMLISGVIFGTMLNNLLSEFTVTILFLILIIYLSIAVNQKLKQFQQKQQKSSQQPLMIKSTELKALKDDEIQRNQNDRLQEILQKENQLIPLDKLKVILHIYVYTIFILLCKGGRTFDSIIGLERCSYGTWIFSLFHFTLSFLYTKSLAIKKYQLDTEKENLGFVFENVNKKMTANKMRKEMFNGFMAGMIGGALGIGSGMVLVPIWLKQDVERNTAAATAGPLIFFSSSISFLISILLQKYQSYMLIGLYFAVSLICSFGMMQLILYISETYGLKKLPVYLIFAMMIISFIILVPVEYLSYLENPIRFVDFDILC